MMKRRNLLTLLVLLASPAFTQVPESNTAETEEITSKERTRKLIEEIKERRGARADDDSRDPVTQGAVYQPQRKVKEDGIIESLKIQNMPVGIVAAMYSDLTGKEVMVSSKVSKIRFSIEITKISPADAVEEFEKKFKELDIEVVELSDEITVLMHLN